MESKHQGTWLKNASCHSNAKLEELEVSLLLPHSQNLSSQEGRSIGGGRGRGWKRAIWEEKFGCSSYSPGKLLTWRPWHLFLLHNNLYCCLHSYLFRGTLNPNLYYCFPVKRLVIIHRHQVTQLVPASWPICCMTLDNLPYLSALVSSFVQWDPVVCWQIFN